MDTEGAVCFTIAGSRIFNFFDPDGHRIEFQQFPPESQQAQAMRRAAG